MKKETKALAAAAKRSTAVTPQVVLNVDAKIGVFRRGTLWTGVVVIDTPMGPLRFAASADEALILSWLEKRAAAQGVETSGLFDSFKKAASSIAKKLSVTKALESAKKLVKDPISAAALKLPTLPGPLGAVQRRAFGAAGNLIKRALGGDKRATALLGALKRAAAGGAPGPMRAWGTVQRLYKLVKTRSPTNILRGLGQEALRNVQPQLDVLKAVQDQTHRLPGPLGTAARAALTAVPGVPLLQGVQAAQQAYEAMLRGQAPVGPVLQAAQQVMPAVRAVSGYGPQAFWPTAYEPYPYVAYRQGGYPYA